MKTRHVPLSVLLGTLLTLLMGSASAQDITYTFGNGSLNGPDTLSLNGYRHILFVNDSDEEIDMSFVRFHEGVTMERYLEANNALNEAFSTPDGDPRGPLGDIISLADAIGGVHLLPRTQASVYLGLEPGNYGVGTSSGGGDTPSESYDLAVTVTEGERAEAPTADFSLHMGDFHFDFPETMSAGEQLWEVSGSGQPHMALVFKLNEGKTAADVTAWMKDFSGEPPVSFEDGTVIQAVTAGQTYYTPVTLNPGTYVAVCPLPNLASGEPHFEAGMVATFTVR